MWDPLSGRELLTLASRNSLSFVAFSPDSERFATAGDDETARVWDTASGRELLTLRGHQGVVQRVAFSPDGKWIATGSLDGAARVWDSVSGREQLTLRGSVGHIESLAFTADGRQLVTAAGGIRLQSCGTLASGRNCILWMATTATSLA
jgi:WD40 repeat protein